MIQLTRDSRTALRRVHDPEKRFNSVLATKQRGFSILAYGLLALAILAAIGGIIWWADANIATSAGVKKGKAEVTAQWQEANRMAEEEAAVRRAASELTARTAAGELAAAQQKGRDYEARWRKLRSRTPDSTLAGCPGQPRRDATEGQVTTHLPDSGAGPVRFSYSFLRLWDGAWSSQAGQPVFPDRPPPEGSDPDTASPIGAGEVLDNFQANASRCSADRLALDALIGQIERLRDEWR